MGILGEDWSKQQQIDILKSVANNPNGLASTGAGLGMGLGVVGVFGGMNQQIFNTGQEQKTNQDLSSKDNLVEKIKQLKEMFDLGAITQEEFDAKKKEILSKM